ncbi:hypothetical protein DFP73DRAFT_600334 [Morchella snyderi]|nr:hypothetical protein DFP73DRAFT_600334 [Morchella snyderi]
MAEMQFPQIMTKGGTLKAPPYVDKGQKLCNSGFLKVVGDADIILKQYQLGQARQDFPAADSIPKHKSDRDIEKLLNKHMTLSRKALLDCQAAKDRCEKVFTHSFGLKGNMIEVFFGVDLKSSPSNEKEETLQGRSLQEVETAVNTYPTINLPPGAFYVALDSRFRRLFVYFNKGLEMVYGPEIGQFVLGSTTWNIDQYSQVHPPNLPKDKRHIVMQDWLLSNPHLCWAPWSRAGVYYWGCWMEVGHAYKGSCITKDVASIPARIQPMLSNLFNSFGNITRAQRLLLGAVDKGFRDMAEGVVKGLGEGKKKQWIRDENDCFPLKACLVNVLTELHYDSGDVDGGWACMVPMGYFRGSDLCIRELGRRFNYQSGGVGYIRGSRLEHCTSKWEGVRFCLVGMVHESVQRESEGLGLKGKHPEPDSGTTGDTRRRRNK